MTSVARSVASSVARSVARNGSNVNPYFQITVDTTKDGSASDTFVLPLKNGLTYDFEIENWGDDTSEHVSGSSLDSITHQYASSGIYKISISGVFPQIYFNGTGDRSKLIKINNWGDIEWQSFEKAFYDCRKLEKVSAGKINVSNVSNFNSAFNSCRELLSFSFLRWDFQSNISMSGLFLNCLKLERVYFNKKIEADSFYRTFGNCPVLKGNFNYISLKYATDIKWLFRYCDINDFGTTTNYDNLLIHFLEEAELYNKTGMDVEFGDSKYSDIGEAARNILTKDIEDGGYGWTIVDGGKLETFDKAKFVFTTDDGSVDNYTHMYPLYEEKGIKGVFYVPSKWMGSSPAYISVAQAIEMVEDGHMVESHSANHTNLTTLSESELNTEFTEVNNDFDTYGLPEPQHIAYPFGENNALVRSVAAEYYKTGRLTSNGTYLFANDDKFTLPQVRLDMTLNDSERLAEIKEIIDNAIRYKCAIIFDGHGALPDEEMTESTEYKIQLSYLEEIIDYVQAKDADIITIEQLYQLMV